MGTYLLEVVGQLIGLGTMWQLSARAFDSCLLEGRSAVAKRWGPLIAIIWYNCLGGSQIIVNRLLDDLICLRFGRYKPFLLDFENFS